METPQNDLPESTVPENDLDDLPESDLDIPEWAENDLDDLPESDLDIPDDPILDFLNRQCHSSENLDQAL